MWTSFWDLSEPKHGVALLNESKYGHSVIGNVMSLSLLRAPKRPDQNCDIGEHHFSFAIYPHDGDMTKVVNQAISYNCPLIPLPQYINPSDIFFSLDSACLILETVKMKHDSTRSIILRLYESIGSRGGPPSASIQSSRLIMFTSALITLKGPTPSSVCAESMIWGDFSFLMLHLKSSLCNLISD